MSFDSLGLSDFLLRSLDETGYGVATPIQEQAIPLVLKGGDMLAAAQTGSGKTAAFVLPILQRQIEIGETGENARALILVPTRELASQVGASIERYGRALPQPPKTVLVYGGMPIDPQLEMAKAGADIVVATPGRLLDLVEREALELSEVQTLVLDEADRLLALGFADQLNALLARLPSKRQNLLFSATFPASVMELADTLLNDPEKIQLETESVPVESIIQRAIEVERDSRTALLKHLIKTEGWERALVFVATKRRASNVAAKLAKSGIRASVLHGDLKQEHRTRALESFKASNTQVLMATDLAARGIDIAQLPCVVNFDLPRSPADYVHRIGRTGRAGESGMAVSFICVDDDHHFKVIERRNKSAIERERIEGFVPAQWDPDSIVISKEPVKGKRKSKKDKLREAGARKAKNPADAVAEEASEEAEKVEEAEPVIETVKQSVEEDLPVEVREKSEKEAVREEAPKELEESNPWAQALKKAKEQE